MRVSARFPRRADVVIALVVTLVGVGAALPRATGRGATVPGRRGGTLVVAQTSEPKSFNPLTVADQPTRDVLSTLSADLIHINRRTLQTEFALAAACDISRDGRHYIVRLREGLAFSDGVPLTADDVVFSFAAYLDARVNSPQRDLLLIDGQPITATQVGPLTVRFDLPAPYAPGVRLFDSFWILPKHKLERAYKEGTLAQAWAIGSTPDDLATAGPFRLKQYLAGQRIILERNPHYWKRDDAGQPLPYLDRLEITFAPDQNAQLLRLMAHEVSAAGRLRADDFPQLAATPFLNARDAGAGLEYNFVFFNWGAPGPAGAWFRSLKFRQAVATAIDRDAIVRLAYQGRGSVIGSQITPGNPLWRTDGLTQYPYDPARAEQLLREDGFVRNADGALLDRNRQRVDFSLFVSASNQPRRKMAVMIQDDLARLGIVVRVQTVEFGALVDAVLKTRRFDAALWGVASGDADPNSDVNVWKTVGTMHVWNMKGTSSGTAPPFEPWEHEVDRLLDLQMTATSFPARKAAYDRVQQLVTRNVPVVFLASPHVLAAADRDLGNFEPAALDPVVLWNADRLFWQKSRP
jgi:peptide/nickel transport system substrate-binding protein